MVLPTAKEELIGALLVENAPGNVLDLFERLRHERDEDAENLKQDLEEFERSSARP